MQTGSLGINKPFGTQTVLSKIMPTFAKSTTGVLQKPIARVIQ